MKRLLLAATMLGALAGAAQATNFTFSEAFGTGQFGTISGVDNGNGNVDITIQMAPNVIIDTGSHFALTLSLLGTGRIVESSFNLFDPDGAGGAAPIDVWTAAAHGGSYSNSPFGSFTDAVIGSCPGPGNSGNCGSVMSFSITGFQGFGAASGLFDPPPDGGPRFSIFAAVDIRDVTGCSDSCTGAVGAGGIDITSVSPVPGPIVGAGIPGLISACFGMFALARRRRQKTAA